MAGIEDDELGPDLAGALALEQGDQPAQVLEVEGVGGAAARHVGLLAVPDHGAVQAHVAPRRLAHKLPQRAVLRDAALQPPKTWNGTDISGI